jgi:hypothetical protein
MKLICYCGTDINRGLKGEAGIEKIIRLAGLFTVVFNRSDSNDSLINE